MNRGPAGLMIYHNTSMKDGNGISSDAGWQQTQLKNNIIMGRRYCFEEYGLVSGSVDDWDYNAYYSTRDGTSGQPWFKWDNIRYDNVSDLRINSGIDSNAIALVPADLENVLVPLNFATAYDPINFKFLPIAGAPQIDEGTQIDHLNKNFVIDGAPDIGALEAGMPLPVYGPDFTQFSSVDIVASSNDLCIFPNPTTHFISLRGSLADYNIRILDVNGQLVQLVSNSGDLQTIDISMLGEGLYFIELENNTNQQIYIQKILKYN